MSARLVLPDAEYLVLSSRLIPDLDGGYTIATLGRAATLAGAGARPLLLTVDPGTRQDHAAHRRELVGRGVVASAESMRNLFDEAVADPAWLRAAAVAGEATAGIDYRDVRDDAGHIVVSIPIIAGDPDWHLTEATVVVPGAGVLPGFRGLYLAWLDHVVAGLRAAAGDSQRPVVVVCESRQLGELLVSWRDPDVRIVHTIHTIHLEPPYTADAPVNALWTRWFATMDAFDAVLWPTAQQRDDVAARFGPRDTFFVAPNPGRAGRGPAAGPLGPPRRDEHRAVMLNRLAPGKRVDHAIAAWRQVVDAVPDATLDVYGDGALRDALDGQIRALGLGRSVTLRGRTEDQAAVLDGAAFLLSSTAFEGQGLAIAEALERGRPVVTYDVRYGPRAMLGHGGGVLVADGDVDALATAAIAVLTDDALRQRLTVEAVSAGLRLSIGATLERFSAAVRFALDHPSRRTAT